eukprot:373981_1
MSQSTSDCVDKIDCLLAKYYIAMGRNNYFNNDGIGKFKLFCDENGEADVIDVLNPEEEQSNYDSDGSMTYDSDYSMNWILISRAMTAACFADIDHEFPFVFDA